MHLHLKKRLNTFLFFLLPLLALLILFEGAVRINYFYKHHYDTAYLVMPFQSFFGISGLKGGGNSTQSIWLPEQEVKNQQSIIDVPKPCRDYEEVKEDKRIVYTYNIDCFRGREIERQKESSVFRIAMLGDSTVFGAGTSDDETVPYYLEGLIDRDYPGQFAVLNAGFGGYHAGFLKELLKGKLTLYEPDLILYYEAINNATNNPGFLDTEIGKLRHLGNLRTFIHESLYYQSMAYTYLLDRYYMYLSRGRERNIDDYQINDEFSEDIKGIIEYTKSNEIGLVFVKQVINYPLEIDGFNTLDFDESKELYEAQLAEAMMPHSVNDPEWNTDTLGKVHAVNQRYLLHLMENLATKDDIPVIDFLASYDEQVPKEYFADFVHQHAAGNLKVAEFIYEQLKDHEYIRRHCCLDGEESDGALEPTEMADVR